MRPCDSCGSRFEKGLVCGAAPSRETSEEKRARSEIWEWVSCELGPWVYWYAVTRGGQAWLFDKLEEAVFAVTDHGLWQSPDFSSLDPSADNADNEGFDSMDADVHPSRYYYSKEDHCWFYETSWAPRGWVAVDFARADVAELLSGSIARRPN